MTEQHFETQHFETPGEVAIRIVNAAGTIELATHPEATTDIEIHSLETDAGSAEVVEQTRVEHRHTGGRHQIIVEVPTRGTGGSLRSWRGAQPEVAVVVRLPQGATIDVTSASASVRAVGRFGEATVEAASGRVMVEDVDGDLTVHTASGRVEVGSVAAATKIDTASGAVRCGALGESNRIETASGRVTLTSARGHLEVRTASGSVEAGDLADGCRIRTVSGDQRIERAVAGRAHLQTVSGSLLIGVAQGSAVSVDAETVTGRLSSEIDLDEEPVAADDGPHLELRARSVRGDVRLERAGPERSSSAVVRQPG